MASVFQLTKAREVQLFGEVIARVDTQDSVVALTFDDGPVPRSTEVVLSSLASAGARATFFLTGEAIETHSAAARQIVAAGHEIGNHSYSHPRMLGLSVNRIASEVERTDIAIRQLGYEGPIHFRSPYGKRFVAASWYLGRTDRVNVMWDVEGDGDPEIARSAPRIVEHVLTHVRPGSIVLLHVMGRHNEEKLAAVPAILAGLSQRGYRLVTVSDLLNDH